MYKHLVMFHDCRSLERNPKFEQNVWKPYSPDLDSYHFCWEDKQGKFFEHTERNNKDVISNIEGSFIIIPLLVKSPHLIIVL